MSKAEHFIKGSSFITLRAWSIEHVGEETWRTLVAWVGEEYRDMLHDPLASAWYPESAHAAVLQGVGAVIAEGNFDRYRQIIHECTTLGMRRFARMALRLVPAPFVIRRCPTLWSLLRRGPATLHVDQRGDSHVLSYANFPFFHDLHYRVYFEGILSSIVENATGHSPRIKVLDWSDDSLVIEIIPTGL